MALITSVCIRCERVLDGKQCSEDVGPLHSVCTGCLTVDEARGLMIVHDIANRKLRRSSKPRTQAKRSR